MARKRQPKQTEKPVVALEELSRDAEELTNEEAEATKGGSGTLSPSQSAALQTGQTLTPEQKSEPLIDPYHFYRK